MDKRLPADLRTSMKESVTHLPIIALTANAMKGDSKKALEAGCNRYLSKPINIFELLEIVRNLAERHH